MRGRAAADCYAAASPLRVITPEEYAAIGQRVFRLVSASQAEVRISHGRRMHTEIFRGDTHMVFDRVSSSATLTVAFAGRRGEARTNQLDETGLQRLVAEAEAAAREVRGPTVAWELVGPQQYPTPPQVVFDSVLAMSAEARATLSQAALEATEAAGLIGSGDLSIGASSSVIMNTAGLSAYQSRTYGEFSLTARTTDGTGSGWAWSGHEDWARVEPATVIARAVDLAQRSARPTAIEPGRYTVILEPAAVAALLSFDWDAEGADRGDTAFSHEPRGTNKIGLQLLDARLGVVSNPWDPAMPRSSVSPEDGSPLSKVVWFERGVLKNLQYMRSYARQKGRVPVLDPGGVRLTVDGASQRLEEMIASTERGLWINRLSGVFPVDSRTLLLTGSTRDGTFLIENGKITKAVKNLRFTESLLFVLNKLEAAGEPVRASSSVVAPRVKLRDFNFTSMTEAV